MDLKTGLSSLWLIACSFTTILYAQQPTFTKVYYDVSGRAQAYSIVKTFDQNYLIAGEKDYSAMVMKVNPSGDILWSRKIGNSVGSHFNCIAPSHDSCFVLAGATAAPGPGEYIYVVKVTSGGDTLWTKVINMAQSVYTLSVQETTDHGFILAGYRYREIAPYSGIVVIKLDEAGNILWTKVLTADGYTNSFGYGIKQTPDGGYIVSGELENSPLYSQDACLVKLTSSGTVTWAKKATITSSGYSSGWDVAVTPTGFLCSLSVSGLVIMKTDFSGNFLWGKNFQTFNGVWNNNFPKPKLHPTSDGGYVFHTSSIGPDNIMRIDSSGNIKLGEIYLIIATDVIESLDSGYVVLGNGPIMGVNMAPTNNPQIGLIKTDSSGSTTGCVDQSTIPVTACTVTLTPVTFSSVTEGTPNLPTPALANVALSVFDGCVAITGSVAGHHPDENAIRVSPNPSDGRIRVINNQPDGQPILTVEVFNPMGEKVYRFSPKDAAGSQLDLTFLPNGIYFVRALYIDKAVTEKIVLNHR